MSMIVKTSNILFLIIIMLMCCAKPQASSRARDMTDSMMTKEKAIKVAQDTAIALGYKLENMNFKVSFYDTPWNEFFPKESNSDYYIKRKKMLEGKSYWAVYFHPKQNEKGGDICVFIDGAKGNVLTLYRGK